MTHHRPARLTAFAFAAVACAGPALICAGPALADSLTYTNDRFGTRATFDADLFDTIAPPPANGDGRTFLSADGAALSLFGAFGPPDASPSELLALRERVRRQGGASVTYSTSGADWFVLSGYDADTVYYERHEMGADAVVHSLTLRYPERVRAIYDPLIEPVTESLDGP